MNLVEFVSQPWPWWVSGPLIGLTVPLLLVMGNKSLGVSSSLRHFCAAVIPAKIPFFQYDWKKEVWNLFFVGGIFLGAMLASTLLKNPLPVALNPRLVSSLQARLVSSLQARHVQDFSGLMPADLFSFSALLSAKGGILIVLGGLMVGFGTRYAGGCTSGHSIMGLSNLQWPSLVATCCFMAGGILVANFIIPLILNLK